MLLLKNVVNSFKGEMGNEGSDQLAKDHIDSLEY